MALALLRETAAHVARQMVYAARVATNPSLVSYQGLVVPLRATPDLQRIRRVVYAGDYEYHEMRAVEALLRPNDTVLEIGAGCGIVSAFIAKRLASPANLTAVEANRKLLPSLEAVARANGVAFHVVSAAVARESGRAEFHVGSDFLFSSLIANRKTTATESVETIGFRDLVEKTGATFVVMDIEGGEKDILDGPIPASVRVICAELHPHLVGDGPIAAVMSNLLAQGFKPALECAHRWVMGFYRGERGAVART